MVCYLSDLARHTINDNNACMLAKGALKCLEIEPTCLTRRIPTIFLTLTIRGLFVPILDGDDTDGLLLLRLLARSVPSTSTPYSAYSVMSTGHITHPRKY